jgi:hypothetical protein
VSVSWISAFHFAESWYVEHQGNRRHISIAWLVTLLIYWWVKLRKVGKIHWNQSLMYVQLPSPTLWPKFFLYLLPFYSVDKKKSFWGRKYIGGALAALLPQIMPMRNHINVGINIETNLACTSLMCLTCGAPAATHKLLHWRDFNTNYFVLKNQLNQTVSFLKTSSFALNNIHITILSSVGH